MITTGNVGIGIGTPASKLEIADGDLYLSTIATGVIQKSPSGDCWRLTVSDLGVITAAPITCPTP